MWSNFWAAGGWGMYPVAVFGFLLVAGGVLYAIRPGRKLGRLLLIFGMLTFGAGLLGTFTGMCNTFHYLEHVAPGEQLGIMAMGLEESLHNAVLSLILVVLSGLGAAVGTLRAPAQGEA